MFKAGWGTTLFGCAFRLSQVVGLNSGITVIPAAAGDLVTLSGEPFLPTVMYRIDPRHARAVVELAGQTATKSQGA